MRYGLTHILSERTREDWAWLALLASTGLYLLLSEHFWNMLPF